MIRIFALCGFLALAAMGCASTPADLTAFIAIKNAWGKIGPEYISYVEKDPALQDDQKASRGAMCLDLTRLLEDKVK